LNHIELVVVVPNICLIQHGIIDIITLHRRPKRWEKKKQREAQFVASKTLRKPFQPMVLILTIAIK